MMSHVIEEPVVKTPRKRRSLRKLLGVATWICVVLAGGGLVFAYLLPQYLDSQSRSYLLLAAVATAVRVVQLHLGIAFVFALATAAMLRRSRLAAVSAVLAAVCITPYAFQSFPKSRPVALHNRVLRVMTLNALYNNRDAARLTAAVLAEKPDVLIIQELSPTLEALIAPSMGDYPHRFSHADERRGGLAIYSREPLLSTPQSIFPSSGKELLRTTVSIGGGSPVTLFAVHFTVPTKFEWLALNRLEFAETLGYVAKETNNVILAGDFNATEYSPNVQAFLRAGLQSAHDLAGDGRQTTFPVGRLPPFVPGIRIDHVFFSKGLTATRFVVGKPTGSDHLPVVADIAIPGKS